MNVTAAVPGGTRPAFSKAKSAWRPRLAQKRGRTPAGWLRSPGICGFAFLLLCVPVPCVERPPSLSEGSAKAAFLYNLTKFVAWPASRENSPFVVCVVQGGPIDAAAPTAFAGRTVAGRSVDVRLISKPAQVPPCQVLFMAGDNAREIRPMLKAASANGTLTVGDSTALLDLNGMISIVLIDLHLELHMNRESLQTSGLSLAPQLLRLVKERKQK